jgi:O-antigen/teichoic acid export membrane protein
VRRVARERGARLRLDFEVGREGTAFGLKAWLTGVSHLANSRLDQLLMVGLVESSELGLYAVAATAAEMPGLLAVAVGGALLPRVAAGDREITARSLRITLVLVGLMSLVLAVLAKPLLTLVFGTGFAAAATAMQILLIGGIFAAASRVLMSSVIGAGRPGAAAFAQFVALTITVAGLLYALPLYGIIGAAVVSFAAYAASFVVLFAVASQLLGGRWRDYLVPRAEDSQLVIRQVREMITRREAGAT